MNEEPIFDHEKLDVYQIELLFVAWVAALLTEVRSAAPGFHAMFAINLIAPVSHPCSTPLRATESVRENKERSSSTTLRGSAVECAACLDALAAKTLVTKARIAEGKALLLRIVGMLTKLVERFDAYRAREGEETDD